MEENKLPMKFSIDVKYKLLSYFAYPTGTTGSSHLARTVDKDNVIYKLVETVLDDAVKKLGFRRDNKEAVKCMIDGFDDPVYLFDFDRIMCSELSETRRGREYPIDDKSIENNDKRKKMGFFEFLFTDTDKSKSKGGPASMGGGMTI